MCYQTYLELCIFNSHFQRTVIISRVLIEGLPLGLVTSNGFSVAILKWKMTLIVFYNVLLVNRFGLHFVDLVCFVLLPFEAEGMSVAQFSQLNLLDHIWISFPSF